MLSATTIVSAWRVNSGIRKLLMVLSIPDKFADKLTKSVYSWKKTKRKRGAPIGPNKRRRNSNRSAASYLVNEFNKLIIQRLRVFLQISYQSLQRNYRQWSETAEVHWTTFLTTLPNKLVNVEFRAGEVVFVKSKFQNCKVFWLKLGLRGDALYRVFQKCTSACHEEPWLPLDQKLAHLGKGGGRKLAG